MRSRDRVAVEKRTASENCGNNVAPRILWRCCYARAPVTTSGPVPYQFSISVQIGAGVCL